MTYTEAVAFLEKNWGRIVLRSKDGLTYEMRDLIIDCILVPCTITQDVFINTMKQLKKEFDDGDKSLQSIRER